MLHDGSRSLRGLRHLNHETTLIYRSREFYFKEFQVDYLICILLHDDLYSRNEGLTLDDPPSPVMYGLCLSRSKLTLKYLPRIIYTILKFALGHIRHSQKFVSNHIKHSQIFAIDHIRHPKILPRIIYASNICLKLETTYYNELKYLSQVLKRTFPASSKGLSLPHPW